MKVQVKMDFGALRQLSRAQAIAVSQTASQMLSEVRNDNIMPFDTGHLQNESSFVDDRKVKDGNVLIVHDTPYAKRLYYNPDYNFQQGKNPRAGGDWWADWLTGSKQDRPVKLFKQLYKRQGGGYVR